MRILLVASAMLALAACKPAENKGPVLCEGAGGAAASYTAVSGVTGVTLAASIDLPRPGYKVTLEMQPEKPLPRRYSLMCTAPAQAGADVITKHDTSITAEGAQVGDEIVVKDAQGDHKVPVEGPGAAPAAEGGEVGKMCGGIAGIACADKQYCAKEVGTCQVADSAGTCQMKPEICTMDYNPVCGCDGKTYSNACSAAAAGMSVERAGECGKPAAE